MADNSPLLGQIEVDEFLQNYWQKNPCVLRQVLDVNFLTADEISGFAVDQCIESRLLTGNTEDPGKTTQLSLQYGPFSIEALSQLPDKDWTLLIQSIDLWDESFHKILEWVDFLPRWRLDDIMVSVAAPGGGVGPHRDQYDVFLIQTEGERHWQVSSPNNDADIICDNDLLQVPPFKGEINEVLQPGDVLYIPPGWRHWGVAKSLCVTTSIGFRAPSAEELLLSLSDQLSSVTTSRFSDGWREAKAEQGITGKDVAEVRTQLTSILEDDNLLAEALGLKVTQPKIELEPLEESQIAATIERLKSDSKILFTLHPASRLSYFENNNLLTIFANGTRLDNQVDDSCKLVIEQLCQHQNCQLSRHELSADSQQALLKMLYELVHLDAIIIDN